MTMSSAAGIDYLNRDLPKYLEQPTDMVQDNPDASVVGNILHQFEATGTREWHKETVEWFLVYLVTELGGTPHNIRDGLNAVSILGALQAVVQDLVSARPKACPVSQL